jgi:hypothetical protein
MPVSSSSVMNVSALRRSASGGFFSIVEPNDVPPAGMEQVRDGTRCPKHKWHSQHWSFGVSSVEGFLKPLLTFNGFVCCAPATQICITL